MEVGEVEETTRLFAGGGRVAPPGSACHPALRARLIDTMQTEAADPCPRPLPFWKARPAAVLGTAGALVAAAGVAFVGMYTSTNPPVATSAGAPAPATAAAESAPAAPAAPAAEVPVSSAEDAAAAPATAAAAPVAKPRERSVSPESAFATFQDPRSARQEAQEALKSASEPAPARPSLTAAPAAKAAGAPTSLPVSPPVPSARRAPAAAPPRPAAVSGGAADRVVESRAAPSRLNLYGRTSPAVGEQAAKRALGRGGMEYKGATQPVSRAALASRPSVGPAAAAAAPAPPQPSLFVAEPPVSGLGGGLAPVAARQIHREASLRVVVSELEPASGRVEQIIAAAGGGGFVASKVLSTGEDGVKTGELVLRVPARDLETVLRQIAALGEVESRSERSEDVTESLADAAKREATLARELRDADRGPSVDAFATDRSQN
jgi:hypothetical protein